MTSAALENAYINEWINYHLGIGIDEIFIYDNNAVDGESVRDVVDESERVHVFDARGSSDFIKFRQYFYEHQSGWCAYIDVDEFITVNGNYGTLKELLYEVSKQKFDAIFLNWLCYSGLQADTHHTGVLDRFTTPVTPCAGGWGYNKCGNRYVKTIINEGLKVNWYDTHVPSGRYRACNDQLQPVHRVSMQPISHANAYIRHYVTKSYDEYKRTKVKRGSIEGGNHYNEVFFKEFNKSS